MIENGVQQSVAQNHVAAAEREAGEIPGFDTRTPARPVDRVGILGAGTMGGGIAMSFVNAGVPVTLVDATGDGLARGRMTTEQVEQRMGLISGGIEDTALAACDLVLEAVFENLDLKRRVCARRGAITKPGTIIATNTSTLDEGIGYQPGDIDVVWTAGYGFPTDRGGPMFMADQIGLRKIADRLAHYAAVRGDPFGYWTPSPLLTRLAEANETISD